MRLWQGAFSNLKVTGLAGERVGMCLATILKGKAPEGVAALRVYDKSRAPAQLVRASPGRGRVDATCGVRAGPSTSATRFVVSANSK